MTAIERTGETWFEADVYRIAGEVALQGPQTDAAKAEAYFRRALAVARQQQAKFWELRAAMSLARLWRDQGKVQQGRELLAPVYGWFTEGFETLDLKRPRPCWISCRRERASDEGDIGVARKAGPVRICPTLCREWNRHLCPSYLTDQDLEKIGVLLGHRRKILAAVAELAAG